LLLGIATLGRISPLAACGAVGIAYTLRALFGLYVAKVGSGIDMVGFLSQLVAPLVACAPMVAAVMGLRVLLNRLDLTQPVFQLALEIPTGIVVFIAAAFLIAPRSARQLLSIVRDRARARLAPAVAAEGSTSPANVPS
jgi:PST family polysaccharide transporter